MQKQTLQNNSEPFRHHEKATITEHTIRPIVEADIPKVKQFTDRMIGLNYYTLDELYDIFARSESHGLTFTLLLTDNQNNICGIRITYPPGKWKKGKGQGLSADKWNVPFEKTAYFQSIFIDPDLAGQGWGPKMSKKAIEMLKEINTKAIVAHSWKESPNDSSSKYLRALGFQHIAFHPKYWSDIDYLCSGCNVKPCVCTAEEMILRF